MNGELKRAIRFLSIGAIIGFLLLIIGYSIIKQSPFPSGNITPTGIESIPINPITDCIDPNIRDNKDLIGTLNIKPGQSVVLYNDNPTIEQYPNNSIKPISVLLGENKIGYIQNYRAFGIKVDMKINAKSICKIYTMQRGEANDRLNSLVSNIVKSQKIGYIICWGTSSEDNIVASLPNVKRYLNVATFDISWFKKE